MWRRRRRRDDPVARGTQPRNRLHAPAPWPDLPAARREPLAAAPAVVGERAARLAARSRARALAAGASAEEVRRPDAITGGGWLTATPVPAARRAPGPAATPARAG